MRIERWALICVTAAAPMLWAVERCAAAPATAIAALPDIDTVGEEPSGPVIPGDATWAGALVIVILIAFFVAAAVIGPIIRAEIPEEVPLQAHDEPPGSSGHHGRSGTKNPEPPDDHLHH